MSRSEQCPYCKRAVCVREATGELYHHLCSANCEACGQRIGSRYGTQPHRCSGWHRAAECPVCGRSIAYSGPYLKLTRHNADPARRYSQRCAGSGKTVSQACNYVSGELPAWAVKPEPVPELVEDEAKRIVRGGEREADYAPPLQDFTRSTAMWSAIIGHPVTPAQMALCMVALELSRLSASPDHRDSIVDGIGYLMCYSRLTKGDPQ